MTLTVNLMLSTLLIICFFDLVRRLVDSILDLKYSRIFYPLMGIVLILSCVIQEIRIYQLEKQISHPIEISCNN
jgi:hypothetical protein